MNFIEDAILPRSSDSLGKECNTAFKTSQGGSKTTFLPIKLQQSIIQAAMYAHLESQIAQTSNRKAALPLLLNSDLSNGL